MSQNTFPPVQPSNSNDSLTPADMERYWRKVREFRGAQMEHIGDVLPRVVAELPPATHIKPSSRRSAGTVSSRTVAIISAALRRRGRSELA